MTIKSKCMVQVPCMEVGPFTQDQQLTGKGGAYTVYEHPDLLRALRALSDYHNWVESRLMPVACAWMEEHKDEFKSSLDEEEQDDIGASIEAAYKVVARTEWWKKIEKHNNQSDIKKILENMKPNPLWQRQSAEYFAAEERVRKGS